MPVCGGRRHRSFVAGLLAAFIFVVAASEALAVIYYVSPAGSDSYPGTRSQPFKTIQKAASIVNPGDTVIVKDGTYTDVGNAPYLVFMKRAGTAENWITFKAENKWGAVIDCQNVNSYAVGFSRNGNYVRIEDFEIRNCLSTGIMSNDVPAAHHVYVYENKIHHNKGTGAYIANGSHYWTFDSNIIYDVYHTQHPNNYHGIYVAHDSSYTTIINNIIYDIPNGWPIHMYDHGSSNPQQGTVIANNTLDGSSNPNASGSVIVAAPSPNIIIENNIFYGPKNAGIYTYRNLSGLGAIARNNLTDKSSICIAGSSGNCNDYAYSGNLTSTNPSFVDPDNRNYHLQSNSPAINKGVYTGLAYDADRNKRADNPDIGAYEYRGTPSVDALPPQVNRSVD